MDIKKIISGGSLGAESAALDVAIRLKIPYGGFTFEDSLIDAARQSRRYHLDEKRFGSPREKSKANLSIADGALIFTHGSPGADLQFTMACAAADRRPLLHIDLAATPSIRAAVGIHRWARRHGVAVLFVTGSVLDDDAGIYRKTYNVLFRSLMLGKDRYPSDAEPAAERKAMPRTVADAVRFLIEEMPLRDKVAVANMSAAELVGLNRSLGNHIRNRFNLWDGQNPLIWSCAAEAGKRIDSPEAASAVIISRLAIELEKTHKLRGV